MYFYLYFNIIIMYSMGCIHYAAGTNMYRYYKIRFTIVQMIIWSGNIV